MDTLQQAVLCLPLPLPLSDGNRFRHRAHSCHLISRSLYGRSILAPSAVDLLERRPAGHGAGTT